MIDSPWISQPGCFGTTVLGYRLTSLREQAQSAEVTIKYWNAEQL
jgi:hypothetical protein